MKPTAQRRRDRRDLLDTLLRRLIRGQLSITERALLAETVREEQRTADQTRRSLGETGKAYGEHRQAADAAIREAEAERDEMRRNYERACETIAAMHAAATGRTGMAPVRGVVGDVKDVRQRAKEAEAALTEERAAYSDLAQAHAAALATAERAKITARRAETALDRVRDAQRLGEALAAVAEYDGLTPEAANAAAAYAEAADSTAARLDEQAREHAIALASAGRAVRECEAAASRSERAAEDHRGALSHALGLGNGAPWDAIHERARTLYAAEERAAHYRDTRAKWAREADAEILAHRERAEQAEHRAGRYRTAWMACRRDRKADRAAMAAEAPIVAAAHRAAQYGSELFAAGRTGAERELGRRILAAFTEPTPDASAALTVDEAADNLRQWAAVGIPAADLLAEPGEQRCPSCEHPPKCHTDPAGCWFTVIRGKPEQNAVCPCAVTFRP